VFNFWTGQHAAEAGLIDNQFKRKCVCCRAPTTENVEHFLFRCSSFKEQRATHLRRWMLLIKRGLREYPDASPLGNLSSADLRRLHLNDADAATRAFLLGGGEEHLQKFVGPDDLQHFGIPTAARGSVDEGKAVDRQAIRRRLFQDVAGFLAEVMPIRGPLLWASLMPTSSRRLGDPG
jgi:hypothetical protein